MDLTCNVKWCNLFASQGLYCKMHDGRNYRHGTPTPVVECFGCALTFEFTYPGTSVDKQGNGPQKHWCIKCTSLLATHKNWLKSVNHAHILHFYKLTKIDYVNLLIAQKYLCGMCQESNHKLMVDHDHSCCIGKHSCGWCVRGLICYDCNIFLGRIDSNPSIYGQALNYIARHKVLV